MKLSLARDVTLTDVESGAVLLDGRHGRYWQLNASGSAVLRRLLDGHAPDEIAAGMSKVAPVAEDRARQDVQTLINSLSAAHLLQVTA